MKVIKRSLKHIINPAEASKCVETQNYDRIGFVLFFLPLGVHLEHVGLCNVQPGRPGRGSGSCSRGR